MALGIEARFYVGIIGRNINGGFIGCFIKCCSYYMSALMVKIVKTYSSFVARVYGY